MVRSGIPKKKPVHCGPCSKEDPKKEGDLRKGRKGNTKTIMYPIKGPPGGILGRIKY